MKLTLGLLKDSNVISILMWEASEEVVHIESIDHPILSLFCTRRLHVLSVGIEQACKATYEGSTSFDESSASLTQTVN